MVRGIGVCQGSAVGPRGATGCPSRASDPARSDSHGRVRGRRDGPSTSPAPVWAGSRCGWPWLARPSGPGWRCVKPTRAPQRGAALLGHQRGPGSRPCRREGGSVALTECPGGRPRAPRIVGGCRPGVRSSRRSSVTLRKTPVAALAHAAIVAAGVRAGAWRPGWSQVRRDCDGYSAGGMRWRKRLHGAGHASAAAGLLAECAGPWGNSRVKASETIASSAAASRPALSDWSCASS
jgi:hypothetical protein